MGKIRLITPETNENIDNESLFKSVFLGGTIDNGDSLNWQNLVINELLNSEIDCEIYNPRREHWVEDQTSEEIEKQIKWEQNHLDKADLIIMVLLDNSKSPISLLELGLYAASKKLIVFCTSDFYRYDNVRLTCEKYNVELVHTINPDKIANKIISSL